MVTTLDVLGWAGSALLVYSVLQTRNLRLRWFSCVVSALPVTFNAVHSCVAHGRPQRRLTAINCLSIVRFVRGRHDSRSFEAVKFLPTEKIYGTSYTASTLTSSTSISGSLVATPIGPRPLPRPHRGGDGRGCARTEAGGGSAQVGLGYVVPKYQRFTLVSSPYRRIGGLL
jgi:hypothetical protein